MKIASRDDSQIVFQKNVADLDGTPKTNLTTYDVRVYQVVSGSEVDVLVSTSMAQVGTSNLYRYVWEPASLDIGEYFVEYHFVDAFSNNSWVTDDLAVLNVPTYDDIETLRKVETGTWEIVNDQMIFYDDDGTTPLFTFNLLNASGDPDSENVYKRERV